ncbi:MAG: NrfD/PsrC family molybdoenzyme membrane anchor subunit [Bacteroidota bacterium]|nr:NrfD/PsrC family molybdoenzyme membrane anchor subunit [Bacteroidota bacterium]
MKEELFVSGRNIPNIDPYLNIWHWQIPIYLFLGGLAAGILFFAGVFTILGKEQKMSSTVKKAPMIVPFVLIFGLFMLFLDLKHKLYFWQLYTTIRLESPMGWGAWVLMIMTPISIIWAASYVRELFPKWDWKFKFLYTFEAWVIRNRKIIAWPMAIYAVILGIYTGILLSAFNARPLWNTAILGPLFLVSGMSTGAATIIMMSKDHKERKIMGRIDILLIIIELFFIIHLFMGFLAGPEVQIDAANLFLGGKFTAPFFAFVVMLGLIFPAVLEILELNGFKVPIYIPAILVLIGGLVFRFLMVEAGQITRYLY